MTFSKRLYLFSLTVIMKTKQIIAGQLFDPYKLTFVPNQVITVSKGFIVNVADLDSSKVAADAIDLRHLIILPGFVDAHVHSKSSHAQLRWKHNYSVPSLL